MPKAVILIILIFLSLSVPSNFFSQKSKIKSADKNAEAGISEANDSEFYAPALLAADLKQAAVVAYVNVLGFELVDQIGQGGCAENKGVGYCLYRLKARVREVFKGKIKEKNFEFYKVTEATYAYKDRMLGRHVVFLNWSDNFPDKKMSLGTMENSTRDIKHNVLAKLRKIAGKRR
jgi:hypothetical protein